MLGHDQQVELGSADPGILDLRGDGIPAAGAQIASAGIAAFGPRAMTRSGEGGCKLAPVSPAAPNGANQRCGRQPGPGEVDAEALLDEQEPSRLGKTERLACHFRLAVTQSQGDWRRAAWGFEQARSVCRRDRGHRFCLRMPLLHSKDALGCMSPDWPFIREKRSAISRRRR